MPESGKLDFCYEEEWGFVITGNSDGLGYLASLLGELEHAPCHLDHIHLSNNERPLGSRSYPLTVYKEADDWFDRLDREEEWGEDGAQSAPPPANRSRRRVHSLPLRPPRPPRAAPPHRAHAPPPR